MTDKNESHVTALLIRAAIVSALGGLLFGFDSLPALLFFVMLFTIPKSPRWLVGQERFDEAQRVLAAVGEQNIDQEMVEIKASLQVAEHQVKDRLFQKKYLYPIFLGISVAALGQLSFVNGFLYYLNDTLDAITGDSVRHAVTWKGKPDAGAFKDKPIILKFYLDRCKLYSFTFEPENL